MQGDDRDKHAKNLKELVEMVEAMLRQKFAQHKTDKLLDMKEIRDDVKKTQN